MNNESTLRFWEQQGQPEPEASKLADAPPKNDHLGVVDRFFRLYGHDHVIHAMGRTYLWDGKRYREDESNEVDRQLHAVTNGMYKELARFDQSSREGRKAHDKHRAFVASVNRGGSIEQILRRLKAEVGIHPDDLDAHPWLLNVENGIVDLRTGGKLLDHDRELKITRIAPVHYDRSAKCPGFLGFLEETFCDEQGNDGGMIGFIQVLLGSWLSGRARRTRRFVIFYGEGRNGKTVLMEILEELLGDYFGRSSVDLFKPGTHETHIADLAGRRISIVTESAERLELAIDRIKMLTGEDHAPARRMRCDPIKIRLDGVQPLITNKKPKAAGGDPAFWEDRVLLVPFLNKVSQEKKDPDLKDRLVAEESPGILAWLVEGCMKWIADDMKYQPPSRVTEATREYQYEEDTIQQFLQDETERCHTDLGAEPKKLYRAYVEWCNQSSEDHVSRIQFPRELKRVGFEQNRSRDRKWWAGIALIDRERTPKEDA